MMRAVAGALDDTAVMSGDGWIDEVAAEPPQARKGPILVGAGKPAITDNVGHQDRRELAVLAQFAPSGRTQTSMNAGACPQKRPH